MVALDEDYKVWRGRWHSGVGHGGVLVEYLDEVTGQPIPARMMPYANRPTAERPPTQNVVRPQNVQATWEDYVAAREQRRALQKKYEQEKAAARARAKELVELLGELGIRAEAFYERVEIRGKNVAGAIEALRSRAGERRSMPPSDG